MYGLSEVCIGMASRANSLVSVRNAMASGFLLCFAWYYTILAGFFTLYCPVMYLMFLHHKLYRHIVDLLFALWELYPVALFQWCYKTKIHHFGDYVNPYDNTIIIMNHRTRVDWNYVWVGLYHATENKSDSAKCICKEKSVRTPNKENSRISRFLDFGNKSKIKFVLKDEIKSIPGIGWIMQLNFFLYVKRDWRQDQLSLSHFVEYYTKLQYPCRLVLFPEGTDLSNDNRRRSEKFALANNLPHYDFVLHPRTTGWAALCSRMRLSGLASVYDVTIAYDKPAQTEADLLLGRIPTHVYFHIKRYPVGEIPCEEENLRNWLNDRWRHKETSLRKFHSEGSFIDSDATSGPQERPPRKMFVAKIGFLFWTIIDIIFTIGILNSAIVQFWVLYHSLLFIFVTWYFGGFHNIQYKLLHNFHVW